MQPFRPPLLRKDTADIVRETLGEIERLERGHAEIEQTILQSRARLAETRETLTRLDAAIGRFNTLR